MTDLEKDDRGCSISIRRQIVQLARQKRCRRSDWTPEVPTEWRPHTVRDANDDFFTDAGAWHFVADLVENGQPMRAVPLRNPPGKSGFEMKVRLAQGREIYIKVRLGSPPGSGKAMIFGYSFHYSVYS